MRLDLCRLFLRNRDGFATGLNFLYIKKMRHLLSWDSGNRIGIPIGDNRAGRKIKDET